MMPAPEELGVVNAYQRVKKRFDDEQSGVVFAFGDDQRDRQRPPGRYAIWVPGDDGGASVPTNARLGTFAGPKQRTSEPRALVEVAEYVTVYTWGSDLSKATQTESDRSLAQYVDARALWDGLLRAMFLELHGIVQFESASWFRTKAGANFGKCIRSVFRVDTSVLDIPFNRGPAWVYLTGLGFDVAGELLDVVDHVRKDPS